MPETTYVRSPDGSLDNEPHAKRGWLNHGNASGDPSTASRCGAKTRRGTRCKAPAMANGRCRMHGGLSTGPKTPEGLERSRKARWKHGRYSAEAKRAHRAARARSQLRRQFIDLFNWAGKML